jgi:hypothetical protein
MGKLIGKGVIFGAFVAIGIDSVLFFHLDAGNIGKNEVTSFRNP